MVNLNPYHEIWSFSSSIMKLSFLLSRKYLLSPLSTIISLAVSQLISFRKLLSIPFHMPPSAFFYLFSFRNGKRSRKTIRIRRQEKWNHVLGFMTAGHFPLCFGLYFFGHFALFFLFFIDIIFLLCLDWLLVNVRLY